MVGRVDQR
jgi:hypothetical protein